MIETARTTNEKRLRAVHRNIRERWVITGVLMLETPAHFGSGETSDLMDMPVLVDELDNNPFLPGASIAGALRNYLREIECGDGVPFPARPKDKDDTERKFEKQKKIEQNLATSLLFGGYRGDDDGLQSPLIVYDAPGKARDYELRDGVAIDPVTRAADDDKKFDMQLLAAGTTFDLRFELVAGEWPKEDYASQRGKLLTALTTALDGLARGEITLGARKRRGFGRCSVAEWNVTHYDLAKTTDFLAWLASEHSAEKDAWIVPVSSTIKPTIIEAFNENISPLIDARQRVSLRVDFALDSTLLIRSGFGEADTAPDTIHLHSLRPEAIARVPVIPGTSWAGVLRHRAFKIACTLSGNDSKKAQAFVDEVFGPSEIDETREKQVYARASRLMIAESQVINAGELELTRVKIDRFTGGAYESALFTEQPLVGSAQSQVTLELTLRSPSPQSLLVPLPPVDPAEIGLLLLLLKDLWTGDLPIGGEAGVGRGRLRGLQATLNIGTDVWKFSRTDSNGLSVSGDRKNLQEFVDEFNRRMVSHD